MATNETSEVGEPVPVKTPKVKRTPPAPPDFSRFEACVGKSFLKDGKTVAVTHFFDRYAAGDGLIPAFRLEPIQVVPCEEFLAGWVPV